MLTDTIEVYAAFPMSELTHNPTFLGTLTYPDGKSETFVKHGTTMYVLRDNGYISALRSTFDFLNALAQLIDDRAHQHGDTDAFVLDAKTLWQNISSEFLNFGSDVDYKTGLRYAK